MMDFFTAEQIETLAQGTVRCDVLTAFHFASGTKRAWNGNSPLETGGETYQPMHGIAQLDGLGASGGTLSENVTITVDGIPDARFDILASALAESGEVDQQLLIGSFQLFDDDWQPTWNPLPIWLGFMQPPRIDRSPAEGAEGAVQSIKLTAENIFFGRARPAGGRYTDRDQQLRSPGDKFLQFVNSIQDKEYAYPQA